MTGISIRDRGTGKKKQRQRCAQRDNATCQSLGFFGLFNCIVYYNSHRNPFRFEPVLVIIGAKAERQGKDAIVCSERPSERNSCVKDGTE